MSRQFLSAAADAAATEAEWDALIEAAENDPEIGSEWSRIWALRDARNGVTLAAGADFCSGVMAAIANDKMLLSNVVVMPSRAAKPARTKRLPSWRSLVPLSAAAGVVAALLVVGGMRNANSPSQSATATMATMPVSVVATDADSARPDATKAAILNAYLMEHSNSLAERSMGGTLANASFAARTADYRPDAP